MGLRNVIEESTGLLTYFLKRGSYTSAHVLLNILNELRKSYKMRGVPFSQVYTLVNLLSTKGDSTP